MSKTATIIFSIFLILPSCYGYPKQLTSRSNGPNNDELLETQASTYPDFGRFFESGFGFLGSLARFGFGGFNGPDVFNGVRGFNQLGGGVGLRGGYSGGYGGFGPGGGYSGTFGGNFGDGSKPYHYHREYRY